MDATMKPADPPPPEDALLAEIDAFIDVNGRDTASARLLQRARDRIAADAKLITRMTDIMNTGAATVAAAEARAQVPREPTQAMLIAGERAKNTTGADYRTIKERIWRAMYDATLAPDSGKGEAK